VIISLYLTFYVSGLGNPEKSQSVLVKAVNLCWMCVTFEPSDGIAQDATLANPATCGQE